MAAYEDTGQVEGRIEEDVIKAGKRRGWRARKVKYEGRHGCPDRWFMRGKGQLVILEVKDPNGERVYAQRKEVKWLVDNGFHAHFVESVQEAVEIFDAWDDDLLT